MSINELDLQEVGGLVWDRQMLGKKKNKEEEYDFC